MIVTANSTVDAIRTAATLRDLAKIGKRRRKLAERVPPTPLTREQRVHRYANQSGWTSEFTPKQRRRLDHKERRAQGRNSYIAKVDGTKALPTPTDEDWTQWSRRRHKTSPTSTKEAA